REGTQPDVYTRSVALAELQAALPESTAVVHFNTGTWNEPTTAFVLTRDGTSAYILPPADSLVDPVRRLVLALQAKSDVRPQARALGTVIAAPIASAL